MSQLFCLCFCCLYRRTLLLIQNWTQRFYFPVQLRPKGKNNFQWKWGRKMAVLDNATVNWAHFTSTRSSTKPSRVQTDAMQTQRRVLQEHKNSLCAQLWKQRRAAMCSIQTVSTASWVSLQSHSRLFGGLFPAEGERRRANTLPLLGFIYI